MISTRSGKLTRELDVIALVILVDRNSLLDRLGVSVAGHSYDISRRAYKRVLEYGKAASLLHAAVYLTGEQQ